MAATTRLGRGWGCWSRGSRSSWADARAADEEKNPLRDELLKLNQATTEDMQKAKLRALVKDRARRRSRSPRR